MSSRRKVEVRISRAADRDIENMAHHMRHAWGEDQLLAYEATIYQTLDMRSRNPQAGRSRDDLFPSCRSFPIEQHVIYYDQPDDATIFVRRVLHQRQDAGAAVIDPRS
jgi:toxin ParE1/3/4